jgi:hypothetical protein
MDLSELIAGLGRRDAWPVSVEEIDVRQTHISVVFLGGGCAYKIRKPIRLEFLDFQSLELRRQDCEREVALNRRLAPDVYLGVVPITSEAGRLRFEGTGEAVEWAVKMRRLPDDATLEARLAQGALSKSDVARLARRVAEFHAAAARNPHIAGFGRFESVAANIRENIDVASRLVEQTISTAVLERLVHRTNQALARLQSVIDGRALRGVPCDTHGDLHLDHVYTFPDAAPPGDYVIVDCIEFNERFRYADPVADMAFLVMDFAFHGRRDLGRTFADAWFEASGDTEGRDLLPLYTSYRAAVRGKVDGLMLGESEVPRDQRASAMERSVGHWLLALAEIEPAASRPGLLLVGGLPGTGKSTLGRLLGERCAFHVLRSDVIRKELAGLPPLAPVPEGFEGGIYTREFTRRTYAECLRRAQALLFEGRRVLIDATFADEGQRTAFLAVARSYGVPVGLLVCEARAETVARRLALRRGDASDADWRVYLEISSHWQGLSPAVGRLTHRISMDLDAESSLDSALRALAELDLWPR